MEKGLRESVRHFKTVKIKIENESKDNGGRNGSDEVIAYNYTSRGLSNLPRLTNYRSGKEGVDQYTTHTLLSNLNWVPPLILS